MSRATPELGPLQLKNSILRAGAGAGKTTTLINLFQETALTFKKERGQFPRMVLTTFTRKATQEIRERLLAEALKKELPELFRYINSRSRVHISTIHGVLSLYLTQYGKDLGLAPEFKLIDGPEVYFREKRILRNLLLENTDWLELIENFDIKILLTMLNQYYQQHFLYSEAAPVSPEDLKLLADSILSDLVEKGCYFYKEISAYDLSESWQTYLLNFKQLISQEQVSIETFVGVIENLGRKPSFIAKKPPFDVDLHERFDRFIKECKAWIQQEALQPSFCIRHEELSQKFDTLAKAFCAKNLQERLAASLLSMSDLEGLSLRLMRSFPWTAEKFSVQWDYWMIDEYQDTSPLQVELLKHLVGKSPHFVVGDPQQSIYLFRGARSDVFHAKIEEVRNSNGDVQTALTNYRSQAPLLEFINSYFKNKKEFSTMIPFRTTGEDLFCGDIIIVEKDEEKKAGELSAILSLVEEKLKAGAKPQEICILARTNRVLQGIAQLALAYQIPIQLHSAGGFSRRREVLDFMTGLKFLANPHDNLNLLCLLRSPWFQVTDSELVKITKAWKSKGSLWDFWRREKLTFKNNILEVLQTYRNLSEKVGISEAMRAILTERGLIDLSFSVDPTGRREANLWKILTDLKNAEAIPGFNPLQFFENLQASAEGQEEGDATPVIEPERVNLMTIHASKGLQFKHVILAGFGGEQKKHQGDWWMIDEVTGKWTLALRSNDQKKISSLSGLKLIRERQEKDAEEADRLLYVAMTRAQDSLSFVWTANPRRGSWASEFPFPQTEGQHQISSSGNNGFVFRVRTQISEPSVFALTATEVGSYRAPFKELPLRRTNKEADAKGSAEGVRIILENARKSSDLLQFLEALRYQPDLWNETDPIFAEPLRFLKGLKEIPFEQIISQGETNWQFMIEFKNLKLRGQVDLWSRDKDQVWLVDYKIGALKDAKSILQRLESAAWAMKEMGLIKSSDQVHLWALYTTEKESRSKSLNAAKLYEPLNLAP